MAENEQIPTKESTFSPKDQIILRWETPAYRQTQKSTGWYVIMGIIVLFFVIYGLFSDQYGWIVSITFLLLAGVYYFSELKPAPDFTVSITDHGVRFGPKYYPYQDIKSFWLVDELGHRNLHLTLHKAAMKDVPMAISPEINLAKIREYLLTQIPEEEGRKESFSDQLIRNMGL